MTSKRLEDLRTWVEVDKDAALYNVALFREIIGKGIRLMAVVKSNSYGHGIDIFPKLIQNKIDWFGVDSFVEALRLRECGIKKPILVLGATLPTELKKAKKHDISVTNSNFEILEALLQIKNPPNYHIKIDTGMHRQGFQAYELPSLIKTIESAQKSGILALRGIYTHFANAKGKKLDSYTNKQIHAFNKAKLLFKKRGFNLYSHAAATSSTLLSNKTHLDMVRIGIGLYGLWPSQKVKDSNMNFILKPVLSWYSKINEIKTVYKGERVGYDLTKKLERKSRIAILPVGYWHGIDRSLSGKGYVLVKGVKCKYIGRISMDMSVIDVTDVGNIKNRDIATIIGQSGKGFISANEIARNQFTINYEVITRINPLIKRILV